MTFETLRLREVGWSHADKGRGTDYGGFPKSDGALNALGEKSDRHREKDNQLVSDSHVQALDIGGSVIEYTIYSV